MKEGGSWPQSEIQDDHRKHFLVLDACVAGSQGTCYHHSDNFQSHQEGVISLAANRWTEMSIHIQEKARDPRNWPMHDFRALWTAQSIPFFLIKHSHVLIYSFLFKIRCKRNWWEPAYFFFWERWQETAGTTEAACCRRSLPGREGRILTGEAGKVQLLPEGQSWDSRTMALRADRAGSNKHPRHKEASPWRLWLLLLICHRLEHSIFLPSFGLWLCF